MQAAEMAEDRQEQDAEGGEDAAEKADGDRGNNDSKGDVKKPKEGGKEEGQQILVGEQEGNRE